MRYTNPRLLYFTLLPLSHRATLLYLGKLSRPRYQQKLNKIMKISQEDVILIKNFYLSKRMVHREWWVNCPTRVGNLEASTVCWRESSRRVQLCGNQAVADRIQRVAVGDLVPSQEDKPKRHRSVCEISYETAILYSSVHRKIFTVITSSHASNDVVLSCRLKPIVSPVSLTDKQRYRLQ